MKTIEELCRPLSAKVGKPHLNSSGIPIRGKLHRCGDAAKLQKFLSNRQAKPKAAARKPRED